MKTFNDCRIKPKKDTENKSLRLCIAALILTTAIATLNGCQIKVVPISTSGPYNAPCVGTPKFRMEVRKNNHPGPISGTAGFLLVNGVRLRMNGPASGPYGIYEYQGNVPYDGDVRYRFEFIYTQGINVTGTSHPNSITRPSNSYIVNQMGQLTWTSPNEAAIPNNFTSPEQMAFRPHRSIYLSRYLVHGFTGAVALTSTITLKNDYTFPITIGAPDTYDASTGSALANFAVTPAVAGTVFPLTLAANTSVTFNISHSDNFAGAAIFKTAKLKFEWYPGPSLSSPSTCFYGPIWINILYTYEPT